MREEAGLGGCVCYVTTKEMDSLELRFYLYCCNMASYIVKSVLSLTLQSLDDGII